MWNVSASFLQALTAAPKYVTTATFTVPGGNPTPIQVESGSVTVDTSQAIRRQCSLTVVGDSGVYEQLMTPGTILHVDHGVDYGTTELVPVFHGEVSDGTQTLGASTLALNGADLSIRLARSTFILPFQPSAGTLRTQVIANVVTAAIPGTIVVDQSTDVGRLLGSLVWTNGPQDVINDLTKDGGTEAFFLPDGSFLIRDRPVFDASPDWTTKQATSASRKRPLDKLYNTVVVTPSATDGSQGWTQQVVALNDTSNPRDPSHIGTVPYRWASPTASTAANALFAARIILNRVLGSSETLSLGAIANPALEGGDVVGAIIPAIGAEGPQSFRHFIDSFSFDLRTGDMTLSTRSAQAADA